MSPGAVWATSTPSATKSEWYDDPFVNNFVQPREDLEFAPQYGCTSILETGDPVVGVWFPLKGNPQPGSNGRVAP